MKTAILLTALLIVSVLCSCSELTVPGGDGSTVSFRHHPAGLPCGFPEGTLASRQPAPVESKEGK